MILTSDVVTESNKQTVVPALVFDLNPSISSLVRLLRDEDRFETRIDAAWVLDAIVAAVTEAKMLIAENEEMIGELIKLIVMKLTNLKSVWTKSYKYNIISKIRI